MTTKKTTTIDTIIQSKLPPEPETGVNVEIGDEAGSVRTVDYEIRTVEQALARAEIDLAVWEVTESKIGSHELGMKMKKHHGGGDGKGYDTYYPIKRTLWSVSVKLRRKIPKNIMLAFEALYDKMKGWEPKYGKLPPLLKIKDPHQLEVSLFDVHFGKMAWGEETGTDYDMKIAGRIYQNATDDLLARTQSYPIETVLFPVGQDYFHVDNASSTTVNFTPQDVDTRYGKMIHEGTLAVIRAIDSLVARAKVKVIWVPGNHDRTTSYHLVRELKAWYRNCDRVEVDAGPKVRKYEVYGPALIGFTHGDSEPHRDLPTIMASEVPQLWAATTDHVWHIGHFHKKKEVRHTAADSFGSCRVVTLPSLSGTCAWSFRNGYTGTKRAAEAFLWSKNSGYTGTFSVNARQ
jgi:hypothetical protein